MYRQKRSRPEPASFYILKICLFQDTQLFETLAQFINGKINLFFGVCSHQGKANQRILWRTCRRNYRIDEYAFVEGKLRYLKGLVSITHIKWNNRAFCITDFKPASRKHFKA